MSNKGLHSADVAINLILAKLVFPEDFVSLFLLCLLFFGVESDEGLVHAAVFLYCPAEHPQPFTFRHLLQFCLGKYPLTAE